MTVQTSFAKKVVRFQNTYDCFLAPLGNDGEFDLALLDVKNRVRLATLRKKQLGPSDTRLWFSHRPLWREMFSARMRPSYSSSRRSPLPRTKPGSCKAIGDQVMQSYSDSDAQNKYPGQRHADALTL